MLHTGQFWMTIRTIVGMTTAGMVLVGLLNTGQMGQSKQLSMDMEKQDWTLEIATILVMSESF